LQFIYSFLYLILIRWFKRTRLNFKIIWCRKYISSAIISGSITGGKVSYRCCWLIISIRRRGSCIQLSRCWSISIVRIIRLHLKTITGWYFRTTSVAIEGILWIIKLIILIIWTCASYGTLTSNRALGRIRRVDPITHASNSWSLDSSVVLDL
jgi:hypothetical protein